MDCFINERARRELERTGFDAEWARGVDDRTRATVVLLHRLLSTLDLWRFVAQESSTSPGALEFLTHDELALRRELRRRADFTSPNLYAARWSSRERRAAASLHFKHFDHWPREKVQAHIDPVGLHATPPRWKHPLRQLALFWKHWRDPEGYMDVERVSAALEGERGMGTL